MVTKYTSKTGTTYLFFAGNTDIYSQWYPVHFTEGKLIYSNSEQYMMYKKAMLFHDHEMADKIINEDDPKKCKALGRKVRNFDQSIWSANCETIVTRGNYLKFSQNERLRKELLSEANSIFVEAAHWDSTWGTGVNTAACIKIIEAGNPLPGKNLLGKCIMLARELILEDEMNGNNVM